MELGKIYIVVIINIKDFPYYFIHQVQELQRVLEENENQKEIGKESLIQQQQEVNKLQNIIRQLEHDKLSMNENHGQVVSRMYFILYHFLPCLKPTNS